MAEAAVLPDLFQASVWRVENQFVTDSEQSLSAERLQAILEAEGYAPSTYGIGRRGRYLDQAVVIDRWSNRWVVYYTERGTKTNIRKHVTEDAACRDLLARVRGSETEPVVSPPFKLSAAAPAYQERQERATFQGPDVV